jgi:hypothetical protein
MPYFGKGLFQQSSRCFAGKGPDEFCCPSLHNPGMVLSALKHAPLSDKKSRQQ